MAYLRPGVFIEETLHPLADNNLGEVSNAVPVFVSRYNRGPIKPTLVKSWAQYQRLYGGFEDAGTSYLPFAVHLFFTNGGGACYIQRLENTDAVSAYRDLDDLTTPDAEKILRVKAISPGAWGNELYVEVKGASGSDRFDLLVYLGGVTADKLVERFVDLSVNPTDPRYCVNQINAPVAGSSYISLTNLKDDGTWTYVSGTDNPATITPSVLSLGDNGSTAPNIVTLATSRLDTIPNSILMVNYPGLSATATLNSVIQWADGRTNVFIVADGPVPPAGTQTSAQVAQSYLAMAEGGSALLQSSRVGLFGPWLLASDPASALPGATRWLPPGGAVMGLYAATDVARGVHKPAAGLNARIAGVVDIEARFTSDDLDSLNQAGVNAIKYINGTGFCIFGARTQHRGFPDRYISTRRTLMFLQNEFVRLTQFAMFEPNNPDLWAQITSTLENFLIIQLQQGVLKGANPDQAFYVVCDETNNPPNQAESGLVNVDIGVSIAAPAEFIVIRVTQVPGSAARVADNL